MSTMKIIFGILSFIFAPVMIITVGIIGLLGLPFGLLHLATKNDNLGLSMVQRPVLLEKTAH